MNMNLPMDIRTMLLHRHLLPPIDQHTHHQLRLLRRLRHREIPFLPLRTPSLIHPIDIQWLRINKRSLIASLSTINYQRCHLDNLPTETLALRTYLHGTHPLTDSTTPYHQLLGHPDRHLPRILRSERTPIDILKPGLYPARRQNTIILAISTLMTTTLMLMKRNRVMKTL